MRDLPLSLLLRLSFLMLAMPALAATAEPPGLWSGPMQSETPATLQGAEVIDVESLAKLKEQGALLLDVAAPPKKPEKVSQDAPWLPIHYSVPGAVWLSDAGTGDPSPAAQERFGARIAALTGGDKQKAVVTFCHPRCWGSWNAAKRLVMLGYAHVSWFPGGVDGWHDKNPVAPVKEDRLAGGAGN
jgi:PQQ-dependent catabolism-associated CXXCW motif protein